MLDGVCMGLLCYESGCEFVCGGVRGWVCDCLFGVFVVLFFVVIYCLFDCGCVLFGFVYGVDVLECCCFCCCGV